MSESKARVSSAISRSRRQWDGLVKTWKRNLQSAWDPNAENKSKNANTEFPVVENSLEEFQCEDENQSGDEEESGNEESGDDESDEEEE